LQENSASEFLSCHKLPLTPTLSQRERGAFRIAF